jgi:hypothetical protein
MSEYSPKHLNYFFLFVLILIFNISILAERTDVVIMHNGVRITGEVKYLRVDILTFKTDNMETVTIQWNKIKSIETTNFF